MSIEDQNGAHNLNGGSGGSASHTSGDITLLDVLLLIARNRALILQIIAFFSVAGLLYAMLSTSKYTSVAKVVREAETEASATNMGRLSLLRGFGVNLGSSATGLSPEAYPVIVVSREVRLNVVRDTFYFDEYGPASLTDFVNQPPGVLDLIKNYTVGLPGTIRKSMRGTSEKRSADAETEYLVITQEEERAMQYVMDLVSVSVDEVTGLMTISASTEQPSFSADLVRSLIGHLQNRIRVLRTQKAREDLQFIEERFGEARDSLRVVENALAEFEDRNTSLRSARLLTERERLKRQVSFKSEVYSELQTQLTQAVINVKRSEPAVTILEQPVVPIEPSAPKRSFILILSIFVGLMVGLATVFIKSFLTGLLKGEQELSKVSEIKSKLIPSWPLTPRSNSPKRANNSEA